MTDLQRPRPRIWTLVVAFLAVVFGIVVLGPLVLLAALVLLRPDVMSGRAPDPATILAALGELPALLTAAGVTSAVLGGVALAAAALSPIPVRERLRLNPARATISGLAVFCLGGVALSQAVDSLYELTGLGHRGALEMIFKALSQARGASLALAVAIVGFLAGLCEELFFRGYLQTRLVERWRVPVGIGVAAFAFALLHADPLHSPYAFLFGIYVGLAVEATGSVWTGVAIHAFNNSMSTLLAALVAGDVPLAGHRILLPLSLTVLAVVLVWMRKAWWRPGAVEGMEAAPTASESGS